MAIEKSTQTHKKHKSEELNNFVNKGLIILDALIHTYGLLKTSHFKINEDHEMLISQLDGLFPQPCPGGLRSGAVGLPQVHAGPWRALALPL